MDCRKYQKEMSRLLDGEDAGLPEEGLAEHLDSCTECRAFGATAHTLDDRLRAIAVAPSSSLIVKVKERVARERQVRAGAFQLPAWSHVPLTALLVVAALGLGNLAGRSVNDMLTAEESDEVSEVLMGDRYASLPELFMELGAEVNGQ